MRYLTSNLRNLIDYKQGNKRKFFVDVTKICNMGITLKGRSKENSVKCEKNGRE